MLDSPFTTVQHLKNHNAKLGLLTSELFIHCFVPVEEYLVNPILPGWEENADDVLLDIPSTCCRCQEIFNENLFPDQTDSSNKL